MEEAQSKFLIKTVRDTYLVGDARQVDELKKLLKAYYFLSAREASELSSGKDRTDSHFVVAALDFGDGPRLQAVARLFTDGLAPLAHRVVFAVGPDQITADHLLFAQEIGARFVAAGFKRNDDLKDYLKRVCLEMHQVGSLAAFEQDIEQGFSRADYTSIRAVIDKLKAMPASEDTVRLLALASSYVGDQKRSEIYLKQVLSINPQNLWAANTLGRQYLRNGQAEQGIEILRKLSRFHELNGERHAALGDAYLKTGESEAAEAAFRQLDALTGGTDERASTGIAKAKLAQHDVQGALSLLSGRTFSKEVISFLNMRAILAIRGGKFDEGMSYYDHALVGAGDNNELKARLKFNVGLARLRHGDYEIAMQCFEESNQIGGARFQRAKGPLGVLKTVMKNKDKHKVQAELDKAGYGKEKLEDVDWEPLF